MRSIQFGVVGSQFCPVENTPAIDMFYDAVFNDLVVADGIYLVPEPLNSFDPKAIGVYYFGRCPNDDDLNNWTQHRVGYVSADTYDQFHDDESLLDIEAVIVEVLGMSALDGTTGRYKWVTLRLTEDIK